MKDRRIVDPKQQFSKWLAKSGAWYWIVFHTALLVVMCIQPETANACVWLALIVSAVMIFHVWAYTKNSTYEKGVLALLDKTKMELSLKGPTAAEEQDEDEQEGESNG